MHDIRPRMLLGDVDDGRYKFLCDILNTEFHIYKVVRCMTFDQLLGYLREHTQKLASLGHDDLYPVVILVAEGLLHSGTNPVRLPPNKYSDMVCGSYSDAKFLYISNIPAPCTDLIQRGIHSMVISPSTTQYSHEQRGEVMWVLENKLTLKRLPRVDIVNFPTDDALLAEQVRCLNVDRNLQSGITLLGQLVGKFYNSERVEVFRLGQGGSGASVFGIEPKKGGMSQGKHVLKLCPGRFRWKIDAEVNQHLQANPELDTAMRQHVPELQPCRYPHLEGSEYIASYSGWHAICMSFLGAGDLGAVVDLETILIGAPDELTDKAKGTDFAKRFSDLAQVPVVRFELLDVFMQWLFKEFYDEGRKTNRNSTPTRIWDAEDAPAEAYIALPPYKLPARTKGYILSFLDSRDARLGKRFFDSWDTDLKAIRDLVAKEPGPHVGVAALDRELNMVLGPAHGDLHANNILMWLEHPDQPFLIDFPFYRREGVHALQDFASLEASVTFGLMDRQINASREDPPALDYTHTQVALWREMQGQLLSGRWEKPASVWNRKKSAGNVNLSFELVNRIRNRAKLLQERPVPGVDDLPSFADEYFPALLYHTLRTIGYPSLSIFKRLLAVYSAARILDRLRA